MEASKLTIRPENLQFKKMTMAERSKLRRQNIMDLIESKPSGFPIPGSEFMKVTRTSIGSVWSMLKTMEKQGMIARMEVEGTDRLYSYTVLSRVKVRALQPKVQQPKPISPPQPENTDPLPIKTLTEYAKDYVWEKNDDSLRGFISWMDTKELRIRREAAR